MDNHIIGNLRIPYIFRENILYFYEKLKGEFKNMVGLILMVLGIIGVIKIDTLVKQHEKILELQEQDKKESK